MARDPNPDVVIGPASGLRLGSLIEIWRYRSLLGAMAWRGMRARFADMWLGAFWILARPIAMTLSFVFIRTISDAQMGGAIPYPLFAFSGLVLWFYMAGTIGEVSNALSRDAGLVQKVYFPRLLSPATPLLANLVELALAAFLIAAMMAFYGMVPDAKILLLPLVLLQIMLLVFGMGLVFCSLNMLSRDWDQAMALVLYLGLFISPVLYSADRLSPTMRMLYHLNPFAGSIEAFRACLFAPVAFPVHEWIYAAAFSSLIVLGAVLLFNRSESQILDKL